MTVLVIVGLVCGSVAFLLQVAWVFLVWRVEERVTQCLRDPQCPAWLAEKGFKLGATGFSFRTLVAPSKIIDAIGECPDRNVARLKGHLMRVSVTQTLFVGIWVFAALGTVFTGVFFGDDLR